MRTDMRTRREIGWRDRCPLAGGPGLAALAIALAVLAMTAACGGGAGGSAARSDTWGTNAVTPADLVKELAGAGRPIIVYTGPPVLYRAGHIPGAVFHGTASSSDGLSEMKTWAQTLPRSANLVVYCGCCPPDDCPNLRPAYGALRELGFTNVRVLVLPNNFGIDWAERGYPVER